MKIIIDDLSGFKVIQLLNEHLAGMKDNSPPESIHALDLNALRKPDITFWSVWEGQEVTGCGALKRLTMHHAELKSMRTAKSHLRKGVATHLLQHILIEAKVQGYKKVSLETGTTNAFKPAHKLYERFGFTYCGPFSDYRDDSFSAFMTKQLSI
ncbi:GNAT family N-acetyltransferase [Zooshikella harenae]|uniref:GNAT family N-acetyltransferase n=1 Tax=Zooshikella harenae TaxID=2827238 RepID=A0ABS5ZH04_9GAMM|nr:GNAT family N-acetyltransferase [Zooshikella harenae]MBU2713347.1 GNAT family N-acetyltransferase [Zooshikella harenae]